eukprot:gb/GEZN01016025.1/.p1 GENE.gb/GEZN01016025.1/~~gb/GEZN01016025.1/.p1  ORF type:complete len:281 (-),score=28.07 gb/GEZN01016025.1/:25-843(-)
MRGVIGNPRPPLLLIHGYLDSWKSFSSVIPLIDHSIGVIAVTLRGWGDSSKAGPYTVSAYAGDIRLFLQRLGVTKVVLAGHSMGTLISTLVAASYPELVAGLVLIGGGTTLDPKTVVDTNTKTTLADVGQTIQAWPEGQSDLGFLMSFQLDDIKKFIQQGRIPRQFVEQIMTETKKADVRAYKEAWQDMLNENHASMLKQISCPCVVIWGTEDVIFPQVEQVILQRFLATKGKVKFCPVKGATHATHWSHPDAVAAHINEMICATPDSCIVQ